MDCVLSRYKPAVKSPRFVCFFKQETAYEMRISDWRSDVCSADLQHRQQGLGDRGGVVARGRLRQPRRQVAQRLRGPVERARREQFVRILQAQPGGDMVQVAVVGERGRGEYPRRARSLAVRAQRLGHVPWRALQAEAARRELVTVSQEGHTTNLHS